MVDFFISLFIQRIGIHNRDARTCIL